MTRLSVIGGTGYAGSGIVAEAAARGLQVRSLSRSRPEHPVPGVEYRLLDVIYIADRAASIDEADTVVVSLSARGALAPLLREIIDDLADEAALAGIRFGVIGGAGSLRLTPGGPLLVETPDFPEAAKEESRVMTGVLEDLRAREDELDWFFVSPAAGFGSFAPGERLGRYRVGADELLVDAAGESFISGADFATAIVDEVLQPAHRRSRFTVAY